MIYFTKNVYATITEITVLMFSVDNSNLCSTCKVKNHYTKLELTESMLLACKRCSRAYEVRFNDKRMLFYDDELNLKNYLPYFKHKSNIRSKYYPRYTCLGV
jgi:hypothetical protein